MSLDESLWSGRKSSKNYVKWSIYLEVMQLDKEKKVNWFYQSLSQYLKHSQHIEYMSCACLMAYSLRKTVFY